MINNTIINDEVRRLSTFYNFNNEIKFLIFVFYN